MPRQRLTARLCTEARRGRRYCERVGAYHAPYHRALKVIIDELVARFGRALLLDLHSFMGPGSNDVCIGDVHGSTSTPGTRKSFEEAFREREFDVVCNEPFTGGYIVRAYARPPQVDALQLELRYTNYLDCSLIDEQPPRIDRARIATLQTRLRPALARAITAFTAAG